VRRGQTPLGVARSFLSREWLFVGLGSYQNICGFCHGVPRYVRSIAGREGKEQGVIAGALGLQSWTAYADGIDGLCRIADEVRIRAEPHSTIRTIAGARDWGCWRWARKGLWIGGERLKFRHEKVDEWVCGVVARD
jgi:hypothetical protein